MAITQFDVGYPSSPWDGIATNQRTWYDPVLREMFMQQAIYSRFVTSQFNLGDVRTPNMIITQLIPPHGNHDPLGVRDLWLPSSYVDSRARTITFSRYGSKLAYHKYDDMITYWKQDNVAGLTRIIQSGLGTQMTEIFDKLARDAFLSNQFALFGTASATSFNGILPSGTMTTTMIDDIHLGMAERNVPYASQPDGIAGNIIAITSPGVIRDLQYEASAGGNANAFIDVMKYADANRILNNEVGTYHHVRFLSTPRAILYNCGPITVQTTITETHTAGDGTPAPATLVDGVFATGQASGVKNYIDVASVSGFEVNDIVTIHVDRTNANGVTNGVDFRDGKLHNRRIVGIDTGANRLTLDLPLLEDFNTDLGGTVYGYVTKGRNIHTAIFLGGTDGVVMGVGEAPRIYTPRPVDDFDSMYRTSWDAYIGFQVYEPSVFEVWYGAGSNRVKGPRYIG